ISREGVIVIKAQSSRSQEQNRLAAMERLQSLIRSVAVTRKKRIATRPGKAAKKRRLEAKTRRGKIKAGRQRVEPD
ncbi:MAG: aminoacyl-tRNA hydrolase, partial [Gammaproteobacteria bacterium]|nr:aminoacyl-tRNA hydrolase [Gammaproteobacteria bacterium]